MEWLIPLIIIIGTLLLLLAASMPVALAFFFVVVMGYLVWMGGIEALPLITLSGFRSVASVTMIPIPLFMFMGEVFLRSGLSRILYGFVDAWLGRIRARMSIIAIVVGAIFGALCGSGLAATAMLGSTMGGTMREKGYKGELLAGPIAAGAGLAIIIPPSLLAVVLGSTSGIPVSSLLISGIVPGIVLATAYIVWTVIRSRMKPELVPPLEEVHFSVSQKFRALAAALPMGVIMFLVTGVIMLGIATPSEAAALGALGVVVVAACFRGLSWENIKGSTMESLKTSSMCFLIIFSALAFSQLLAYTGATTGLIGVVTELALSPIQLLIVMQFIIIILGCLVDSISIIMLTVPIFMPVVTATGIDPIWFGLLTLINIDIGSRTPPFGLNLFVLKGVRPELSIAEILRGVFPFLIIELIVMVLIFAFPAIATALPAALD